MFAVTALTNSLIMKEHRVPDRERLAGVPVGWFAPSWWWLLRARCALHSSGSAWASEQLSMPFSQVVIVPAMARKSAKELMRDLGFLEGPRLSLWPLLIPAYWALPRLCPQRTSSQFPNSHVPSPLFVHAFPSARNLHPSPFSWWTPRHPLQSKALPQESCWDLLCPLHSQPHGAAHHWAHWAVTSSRCSQTSLKEAAPGQALCPGSTPPPSPAEGLAHLPFKWDWSISPIAKVTFCINDI